MKRKENCNDLKSKIFPFLCWINELKKPEVLRADLIAGITVALVLVPQSMAYAQLAGLPPYYGLYASFLPGIVAALFGSSRQLATGPVAVVSLMTASALEPIAGANPELYICLRYYAGAHGGYLSDGPGSAAPGRAGELPFAPGRHWLYQCGSHHYRYLAAR